MSFTAARPVIATATAITAALILTGCADTDTDLDHGKVVDKRSRAAQGPIYEKVERPAPCRSTRSQMLRTALTTSGSKPKPRPKPPADTSDDQPDAPPRTDTSKDRPRSTPSTRSPNTAAPSAPCGTTTVSVFKGYKKPGTWELKLKDGKATDWESVSREEYDSVEIGDHF
ncbi:hypothetical protein [Streptomyces sp. NPDC091416]|uniref:hypothetical protein n=1 Tax=Streptomyces sp. NPDC091416 TaxID=3366003 RepID=UPI003824F96D